MFRQLYIIYNPAWVGPGSKEVYYLIYKPRKICNLLYYIYYIPSAVFYLISIEFYYLLHIFFLEYGEGDGQTKIPTIFYAILTFMNRGKHNPELLYHIHLMSSNIILYQMMSSYDILCTISNISYISSILHLRAMDTTNIQLYMILVLIC